MFKIGDFVDIKERRGLTHYGRITGFLEDGEKAIVHFRKTRQPKERNMCDDCGWPGFLSISGNTGEIVCMKSGCGHGHGFDEIDEIIDIEKLINITEQRRQEGLKKLKQELSSLLYRYEQDGIISGNTKRDICRSLETVEND